MSQGPTGDLWRPRGARPAGSDAARAAPCAGKDVRMHPAESRDLWHLIETVHAVTYFAPRCREANDEMGFRGFWMGYFGSRAAPMGSVGPGVVTACFGGFEPSMVERAIPDAWAVVTPDAAVTGRARAAASALRAALPECENLADDLLGVLDKAIEACEPAGRSMYAANKDVTPFEDPVEDLWQMCSTLREHRGDGHLAVLTSEGVGGCESHLLAIASRGEGAEVLRESRGWADQDWSDAMATLTAAGVIEAPVEVAHLDDLVLTERGARLHGHLESRTDDLASPPYAAVGEAGREALRDGLIPIASAVAEQGWIPFPNPIGLPEVV